MGFNIKPNLERFTPHELRKGWGILDIKTGEIRKSKTKHRIERYAYKKWAIKRCTELNKSED